MYDFLNDEYLQNISQPLYEISQQMSNDTVGIIANRIKIIGTMTASDANRLRNTMRIADFKKIESELSKLTGLGTKEIDRIFDDVAKQNEVMAKTLYEYRGVEQIPYAQNKELQLIVRAALKNAKSDFLNISSTRAFNLNGKPTTLSKAYNQAIDKAIFEVSQGTVDYNTSMRKSVLELANSGLQTVDYDSGYSRRLDSSVRMNLLDGVRQMSMSMREQQGKEFGADAYEISAHTLCRPSHQPYQGHIYTFEEFETINSTILSSNPIATGELNCRHTKFSTIKEIAEQSVSDKELKNYIDNSNKEVTYQLPSGKEVTKTKYDATIDQRNQETKIRRLKDNKMALENMDDIIGAKQKQRMITEQTRIYKEMSKSMDISPKLKRLTVVK